MYYSKCTRHVSHTYLKLEYLNHDIGNYYFAQMCPKDNTKGEKKNKGESLELNYDNRRGIIVKTIHSFKNSSFKEKYQ